MAKESQPQADRQYLVSSATNRALLVTAISISTAIIFLLLMLASANRNGRYVAIDTGQHEATLAEAAKLLSGEGMCEVEHEGQATNGRTTIAIEDAIAVVAARGMADIQQALSAAPTMASQAEETMGAEHSDHSHDEGTDEDDAQESASEGVNEESASETASEEAASEEASEGQAGETLAAANYAALHPEPLNAGQSAYQANCLACHQMAGTGVPGAFPPLVGHAPKLYNADADYLPKVVLYGLMGGIDVEGMSYNGVMTPWQHLGDQDIADMLNYVVTSWDNNQLLSAEFTPYTAEDIAAQRATSLSSAEVYAQRPAQELIVEAAAMVASEATSSDASEEASEDLAEAASEDMTESGGEAHEDEAGEEPAEETASDGADQDAVGEAASDEVAETNEDGADEVEISTSDEEASEELAETNEEAVEEAETSDESNEEATETDGEAAEESSEELVETSDEAAEPDTSEERVEATSEETVGEESTEAAVAEEAVETAAEEAASEDLAEAEASEEATETTSEDVGEELAETETSEELAEADVEEAVGEEMVEAAEATASETSADMGEEMGGEAAESTSEEVGESTSEGSEVEATASETSTDMVADEAAESISEEVSESTSESSEVVETSSSTSSTSTSSSTTVIITESNVAVEGMQLDPYHNCSACHQINGQGILGVFPGLAEHAVDLYRADRNYMPLAVLYGVAGEIAIDGMSYNIPMRAYSELSDSDIADALNHSLESWGNAELLGNDLSPYTAEEIAALRGQELSAEDVYQMRQELSLGE